VFEKGPGKPNTSVRQGRKNCLTSKTKKKRAGGGKKTREWVKVGV